MVCASPTGALPNRDRQGAARHCPTLLSGTMSNSLLKPTPGSFSCKLDLERPVFAAKASLRRSMFMRLDGSSPVVGNRSSNNRKSRPLSYASKKSVTHVPGQKCYLCSRSDTTQSWFTAAEAIAAAPKSLSCTTWQTGTVTTVWPAHVHAPCASSVRDSVPVCRSVPVPREIFPQ
jgi:hypothetical protein